jgi:hypothetical protein
MRTLILALAVVAAFAARASALTPGELNPQEQAVYATIKADPAAAASFLATRDYVRKSDAVLAAPQNKKLAIAFARPKNYSAKYLLAGDKDKIAAAVEVSLNALAESLFA